MKPTIGRIVIYKDVNGIGEHPAIITKVWNDNLVNLQVFLDGKSVQAKTSINYGDALGQWNWPVREQI